MLIVVLPLLSATAADVYVPLVNVTEPVGVGAVTEAGGGSVKLTATQIVSPCTVVTLVADGVTLTMGVVFSWVTVTEFVPAALL
jgi:hypothetical protein